MKKLILRLSVLSILLIFSASCKTTEKQVISDINQFCDIFKKITSENDSLKIQNQQLKKK